MAAAAGIFNHASTAAQALAGKGAASMATPATDDTSSSSDSSTISANDFLTLLVTELQNQDPTANSDPNEYVNQLVAVNSLEQLININSTLTSDLGSSNTTSSGTTTDAATGSPSSLTSGSIAQVHAAAHHQGALAAAQPAEAGASVAAPADGIRTAPGNLGIPAANAAALRVANALNGQTRSR